MKMNIVEENSINNVPQWKPRVHLMVKVGSEMTQSNILIWILYNMRNTTLFFHWLCQAYDYRTAQKTWTNSYPPMRSIQPHLTDCYNKGNWLQKWSNTHNCATGLFYLFCYWEICGSAQGSKSLTQWKPK